MPRRSVVAKSERGGPFILLRLSPEVYAKLSEVAGKAERGRGGGMAGYVRRLVHEALGFPEPETYAAEESPRRKKRVERSQLEHRRDEGQQLAERVPDDN